MVFAGARRRRRLEPGHVTGSGRTTDSMTSSFGRRVSPLIDGCRHRFPTTTTFLTRAEESRAPNIRRSFSTGSPLARLRLRATDVPRQRSNRASAVTTTSRSSGTPTSPSPCRWRCRMTWTAKRTGSLPSSSSRRRRADIAMSRFWSSAVRVQHELSLRRRRGVWPTRSGLLDQPRRRHPSAPRRAPLTCGYRDRLRRCNLPHRQYVLVI